MAQITYWYDDEFWSPCGAFTDIPISYLTCLEVNSVRCTSCLPSVPVSHFFFFFFFFRTILEIWCITERCDSRSGHPVPLTLSCSVAFV